MAPQRILVGVHDGGVTGIDTYAEQVAVAAARVAGAVTLLATGPDLAERLRGRLEGTGVHVEDLGLCPASATEARMIRVWPGVAARRLARGLGPALRRLDRQFDIAHLNHPPLAAVVRPYARRVCVAAWFYPHRHALDRALATWRHTGARFPRSAALVLKSVSHFRNDQLGYRRSDVVVAATEILAAQLRKQGLPAVHCPPPAHVIAPRELITQPTGAERAFDLVVCAGALGHPRKNVAVALRAVGAVAGSGRRLTVELVGGGAEALRE
jgi:glycosyltransferase involved in cell wall biosynthesis